MAGYLGQFIRERLSSVIETFANVAPADHRGACAIYRVISSENTSGLNSDGTLWRYSVQVDVYGVSPADRAARGRVIRNLLSGFAGDVTIAATSPVEVVKVKACRMLDLNEEFEEQTDPKLYRLVTQYSIWIDESDA